MTTTMTSVPASSGLLRIRRLAAGAALGALGALLVGAALMAVPRRGLDGNALVGGLVLLGPAALAAVSLLDMFTVPGLHQTLHRHGPVLVAVATGCALAGDLLGVIGRLTQLAAVVSQGQQRPDAQTLVLDLLQTTFNAGGFVLVAISFTAFGVLLIRGRSRRLGAVAVAAGVLTGLGQLPGLQVLFYLANVFFLAWYITLGVTFRRTEASS